MTAKYCQISNVSHTKSQILNVSHFILQLSLPNPFEWSTILLSGLPDYFDRNKISSGGDLSHYSSASLY